MDIIDIFNRHIELKGTKKTFVAKQLGKGYSTFSNTMIRKYKLSKKLEVQLKNWLKKEKADFTGYIK